MNNIKHLPQMREWLDQQTGLSDKQRRAARRAIQSIEDRWANQHRQRYTETLKLRNEQWRGVVKQHEESAAEARQLRQEMKAGRISPDDVLSKARNRMAEHNQLADAYEEIMKRDEELAEFAAMTPDEIQGEQLKRFPTLLENAPTLEGLVERELRADDMQYHRRSGESTTDEDADSDGVPLNPPGLPALR